MATTDHFSNSQIFDLVRALSDVNDRDVEHGMLMVNRAITEGLRFRPTDATAVQIGYFLDTMAGSKFLETKDEKSVKFLHWVKSGSAGNTLRELQANPSLREAFVIRKILANRQQPATPTAIWDTPTFEGDTPLRDIDLSFVLVRTSTVNARWFRHGEFRKVFGERAPRRMIKAFDDLDPEAIKTGMMYARLAADKVVKPDSLGHEQEVVTFVLDVLATSPKLAVRDGAVVFRVDPAMPEPRAVINEIQANAELREAFVERVQATNDAYLRGLPAEEREGEGHRAVGISNIPDVSPYRVLDFGAEIAERQTPGLAL